MMRISNFTKLILKGGINVGGRHGGTLKPGETAPKSGQYGERNTRGSKTGREATVTRNEPLPPTEKKGYTWKLDDPTKHKKSK